MGRRALCFLLLLPCLASCIHLHFDLGPSLGPLQETTIRGSGKDRILLMEVTGELSSGAEGGFFGRRGESLLSLVHDQLWQARQTPGLRAVILRINSPGGTVTASDQLYHQIAEFREVTGIPIYAVMMDVAASGGYYVAMAADKVYAQPTTVTGSIGVIMINVSVEGLMEKIGVKSKVVTSGEFKDMGSPLRDFSAEEQAILQSIIDDLYRRFVDVVDAGRPDLSRQRIEEIADGRVLTAAQAVEVGLIDGIFYLPDVIDLAMADAGLEQARIVVLHRPGRMVSNVYSRTDAPVPQGLSLLDPSLLQPLTGSAERQGFYYLWEPGLF